jgi:hypothetical protein
MRPLTIYPQDLGCAEQLLQFFDYVRYDARVAEAKLSLQTSKQFYAAGRDPLGIDIKAGAKMWLYCWGLAKDQTGKVVLPLPGHEQRASIEGGQAMRYPEKFGLEYIFLERPSEDLFGCFGSATQLPPKLHKAWMDAGWNGKGEAIELKRDDILRLLEMMRADPGIVEAYTPVFVR